MADDIELAPQQKSSKVKLIAIVALGMLVAIGGTLGGLFALGILPPAAVPATAESVVEEPVEKKEAFYVSLDPAFTVNFTDEGPVRYLQVAVQAMTRESDVEDALGLHMPMIRNDLMLLFSSKSSVQLNTRQGKEALQTEALASIQGILERETGAGGVEAVYFTRFVMQ